MPSWTDWVSRTTRSSSSPPTTADSSTSTKESGSRITHRLRSGNGLALGGRHSCSVGDLPSRDHRGRVRRAGRHHRPLSDAPLHDRRRRGRDGNRRRGPEPSTGGSGSLSRREALYWHYPHYYPTTAPVGAIRRGDWKLLEFFEDGRLELYNLRQDLSESTNLTEKEPKSPPTCMECSANGGRRSMPRCRFPIRRSNHERTTHAERSGKVTKWQSGGVNHRASVHPSSLIPHPSSLILATVALLTAITTATAADNSPAALTYETKKDISYLPKDVTDADPYAGGALPAGRLLPERRTRLRNRRLVPRRRPQGGQPLRAGGRLRNKESPSSPSTIGYTQDQMPRLHSRCGRGGGMDDQEYQTFRR